MSDISHANPGYLTDRFTPDIAPRVRTAASRADRPRAFIRGFNSGDLLFNGERRGGRTVPGSTDRYGADGGALLKPTESGTTPPAPVMDGLSSDGTNSPSAVPNP